jgi:hypothetical protein
LEALEKAVHVAVLAAGAKALGEFMTAVGRRTPDQPVLCPKCHARMKSTGPRTKTILSLLGSLSYTRLRYACPSCAKSSRYPADEALGISGTSRSPGVQRQVARLGAKEPFHEVAEDLRELAGLTLSRKDAERIAEGIGRDIEQRDAREREKTRFQQPPPPETPKTIENLYIEMDGTGAPMVPWEVQGRKGKQPDGSARTREVKLGCVFTQTGLDEQERPVRDPYTTVYTGAIEDAAAFGQRMYAEAVRNGLYLAKRVVVLADGAEWIKNLTATHFPMAQRIIDLYHAKEHVAALARALFPNPAQVDEHREHWWGLLLDGDIEAILEQAGKRMPRLHQDNKDALRELNYLKNNIEQMRYAQFRNEGLFIGSGVIEAACKNIIGKRLKQSGMEWTVRGANDITALRCAILSRRFTDYWEARAA